MWYDGSVQKWARAVRRSRREPLASLRPGAFCCPDYQEGGTCMAKKEHEKHTISPRSARLQRRVQAAVSACYMMLLTAQPAAAADTMWTRFSTIIADVYGQLVGISTIVGVTAAAVALLVRMISRNERAVAEATSWLKRIVVTWIVLNTLGFAVAYLQPLIQGGQYTP